MLKQLASGLRRANRKLGRHRNLVLKLVGSHEEFGGADTLLSSSQRQTSFSSPLLYDTGLAPIRQASFTAPVPDLHLLQLENVSAVGGMLGVIRDRQLLHPELLYITETYDSKAPDLYRFVDTARRSVELLSYSGLVPKRRLPVALHLLKEHSRNYYHWLFEGLPRLAFFLDYLKKCGKNDAPTILIDEGMPAQGMEALTHVLNQYGQRSAVLKLGRGEMVSCDRLYFVTPFWHSLDNSRHAVNPRKDYVVDQQAVSMARSAFKGLMSPEAPTRKIYLPRKATQVRRIVNAREVEEVMGAFGFESIYPDKLSLRQQVELFSSATLVVGATGAAFSNLVFMQPGSQAVIFSPNEQRVFNYYLFQQQADVARVSLAHLLTLPTNQQSFRVHDDFRVDCRDLTRLLQQLTSGQPAIKPAVPEICR